MTDEVEGKKAQKVSIYFLDEQYSALSEMAKDQDRSVAYLVREAVTRFLAAMGYGPSEKDKAA
jgi:predicted DNA-binding protein